MSLGTAETMGTAAAPQRGGDVGRPPAMIAARKRIDPVTVGGLAAAIVLIGCAIALGGSIGSFVNWPSVLLVVFGTIAVSLMALAPADTRLVWPVFVQALYRDRIEPEAHARNLLQVAEYARKFGRVALENLVGGPRLEPAFRQMLGLIVDGYDEHEIQIMLRRGLAAEQERTARGIGWLRRAAEVAPAMGLLGTLVGLVQMLSQLDDPSRVGPGMAIALLTTFYGALLGTVVFAPMAAKLERRAEDEALVHEMLVVAAGSIARAENPRRLELVLNGVLPPHRRIAYFD